MRAVPGCRRAWLFLFAMSGVVAPAAAQVPRDVALKYVRVALEDGVPVATIEADGPLPAVARHSLDNPPRVYFDLPGVVSKTIGLTEVAGVGVVDRARVAQNSTDPVVSRVVLDLSKAQTVRVDDTDRQKGRIRIFVGAQTTSVETTPAPSAPPPPAAGPVVAARKPSMVAAAAQPPAASPPNPVHAPPAARVEDAPASAPGQNARVNSAAAKSEGRSPFARALGRIEAQRTVLKLIEANENVDAGVLHFANAELSEVRKAVTAMTAQDVLAQMRDLIQTSCTLGAAATKIRLDALTADTPAARGSAASAAAGALMLLDQACSSIRCSAWPR
jgi:hypothetical protein